KKLPALDGQRFYLPEMFIVGKGKGEKAAVNPFLKAFPVRNPTVKHEVVARDTVDAEVLRKLNVGEDLSLLRCPRPFTLAVKQFQGRRRAQQRGTAGAGGPQGHAAAARSSQRRDAAADNARSLAGLLRQGGWEAYVLHTPYYTVVTAGSYDSLEDPRIG